MHMAARRIFISEEAYEGLVRLKGDGESISELIIRLSRSYPEITRFSGAFLEIGEVTDELERERKEFKSRSRP